MNIEAYNLENVYGSKKLQLNRLKLAICKNI
jgi:hypothetical protein